MIFRSKLVKLVARSIVAAAIAAPVALAQSGRTPPPAEASRDGAAATLRAREVIVPLAVCDAEGRAVPGLTKDDFIVAEDDVRQEVTSFTAARAPLNVLLLLDASPDVFAELSASRKVGAVRSSGGARSIYDAIIRMGPTPVAIPRSAVAEPRFARAAADRFVGTLGAADRVSVIQFAKKVELLQDWTGDTESLRHAVDWRYRLGDGTALWDAIYLAADEQFSKVEGRRVLVVFTDGVDTESRVSEEQALAALDRAGVTVYVVSSAEASIASARKYLDREKALAPRYREAQLSITVLASAEQRMREIAERSGGRLFAPLAPEGADLSALLAGELQLQYVLTYVPQREASDGHWHAISVFPKRPGLTIRARKGYVAGASDATGRGDS